MKLNVIVPARNEAQSVPYFFERARPALDALGLDWNIVFVNNCSTDGTFEEMLALRDGDRRVKILTLSRDFGYQGALKAGLSSVDGDYYAIVDADCEDPPELLAEFLRAIQDGAQIAYGIRSERDEPKIITAGRRMFYILNRLLADGEVVMWMGEFSMFTRDVRDAVLMSKSTFPSLRAELGYVGFRRAGIRYRRARRKFGKSHYNVFRMTLYAVGSILAATTSPLRLVLYLAALIGVGFPLVVLARGTSAADAATAAAFIALYFLLLTVPLISLYLARLYQNGVQRPSFLIDESRTHLEERQRMPTLRMPTL